MRLFVKIFVAFFLTVVLVGAALTRPLRSRPAI